MLAMGSSVVVVVVILGLGLTDELIVGLLLTGFRVVVVVVVAILLVVGLMIGVVKAGGGSVVVFVEIFLVAALDSTKGNIPRVRSGIFERSRVGRLLPEVVVFGVVVVVVLGLGLLVGLLVDFLLIGFRVVVVLLAIEVVEAVVVVMVVVVVIVVVVVVVFLGALNDNKGLTSTSFSVSGVSGIFLKRGISATGRSKS